MKVKCNAKELAVALKNTVKGKRSLLPILGCAFLDTRDGVLRIRSTDLDTEMRVEIPATIQEHGSTICPVKEMVGLLKGLTEDVSVSTFGKNTLIVKSSNGAFEFEILDDADYPISSIGADCDHLFTMPRKQLVELMDTAGILVAEKTEPRRVLQAVNIASDNGNIIFTATNGWHLHHATVKPQAISKEFSVNVYPSTLKPLKGFTGETVHCWLRGTSANMLYFSTNKGEVLSTRICDDNYPDYKKFLPETEESVGVLSIEPIDMITLCDRLTTGSIFGLVSFESLAGSKKLTVSAMKGKIELSAYEVTKMKFVSRFQLNSLKLTAKSLKAAGIPEAILSFCLMGEDVHITINTVSNGIESFYFIIHVTDKK